MKILIVNQPVGNKGDAAAHRSLMRSLLNAFPNVSFSVQIKDASRCMLNSIKVENVIYLNTKLQVNFIARRFYFFVYKISLFLNSFFFASFFPQLKKIFLEIENADVIICAPGGICMGGFRNWFHIFVLYYAKKKRKKIVYYSRSFGPFFTGNFSDRLFKKISIDLLNYFEFLSIRDKETMTLANQMNLKYVPSIDTAFLDVPKVTIPLDIVEKIREKYFVFVPNSLTWHYAYRGYDQNLIDSFYIKILNILLLYADFNVVLLPQLVGLGDKGDYCYFEKLSSKILEKFSHRIIILSEKSDVDMQQSIIAGASCVIGARYHSIVFAINNNVPFISLSYEHKMIGLLEILEKKEYMIDISKIFETTEYVNLSIGEFERIMKKIEPDTFVKKKANLIAVTTFNKLVEYLKKYRV